MPIQCQHLRHEINDFHPVIRLLSQWVTKEVHLSQKRKLRQLKQKLVQVSQPIVAQKQHVQKLELLKTIDVLHHVVLAEDLLAAEVGLDVVEVLEL